LKYLLPIFLLLISGCAFGKPSSTQGSATFSIPFDFIYPDKSQLREKKIAQEMDRLEGEKVLESAIASD
jgi:hypothetical protein